jgi:hypothetical protein
MTYVVQVFKSTPLGSEKLVFLIVIDIEETILWNYVSLRDILSVNFNMFLSQHGTCLAET